MANANLELINKKINLKRKINHQWHQKTPALRPIGASFRLAIMHSIDESQKLAGILQSFYVT